MRTSISPCLAIGLILALGHLTPTFGQDQPNQIPIPRATAHDFYPPYQGPPAPVQDLWNPQNLWRASLAFIDAANRHSGMGLAPVDEALRSHLKIPKEQGGLIVTSVEVHSPAALAGIQQNDVLLDLNGAVLHKPEDLDETLKKAGDKPVSLTLLRHGRKLTIKIQPRVRVTLGPVQPEAPAFWIGVSVAPIEPALRAQLQLPARSGLLAIDVVKGGPAAKAGVRPHDILLKLDGEELNSQDKLVAIVQAKGEKTVPLEIVREGKKQTLEITPQRREQQWRIHLRQPNLRFKVVRPGAVVGERQGVAFVEADWDNDGDLDLVTVQDPNAAPKGSRDGANSAAERLDDLAAQIKELRRAIEALTKAAQEKK